MYQKLPFEDYFTICSQNYSGQPIKEGLELANYKEVPYKDWFTKHSVKYQVRYDNKRNCIQCIFKETSSKSDWITNFTFPAKLYDKITFDGKLIQLRAHKGWREMFFVCQDDVRDSVRLLLALHPEAEIEVFGWSLGSGTAQLCAEDIYFKFGKKPHLFTYGSVKPFFGKKTWEYVKSCCQEVYNFYDNNDIVGRMVPLIGWRAINHKKIKQDKFCIVRLFNPNKYHTEYWKPDYYKDLK